MSESAFPAHDELFDSLLGDFLDESSQLLTRLNENLLQLDHWVRSLEGSTEGCNQDLLNEMFRAAHSLKGLSAMLGLSDINSLTHKVENVLDAARKNELTVTEDVVELVFRAVDRLENLVDALKNPGAATVESHSVVEEIGRLLRQAGVEKQQSSQADAERALQQPSGTACGDARDAVPASAASSPLVPLADEVTTAAEPPPGVAVAAEATCEPSATSEAGGQRYRGQIEQAAAEQAGVSAEGPPESRETGPAPLPVVDYFADLVDETDTPSKYLAIFIDEAELSLDQLTETLLTLEENPSQQTVEQVMVIAHRIKGSAASVGLNRPAKLAHLMEDLLQSLLGNNQRLTPKVTDALLMCADALRQYVEQLKNGKPSSERFNQLAHELLATAAEERADQEAATAMAAREATPAVTAKGPASAAAAEPGAVSHQVPEMASAEVIEQVRNRVAQSSSDLSKTFTGVLWFDARLPLAGLKARLIYEKLARIGQVCYFDPPADKVEEQQELESLAFGVVTEKPLAELQSKLRVAGVRQIVIQSCASTTCQETAGAAPAAEPAAGKPQLATSSTEPARPLSLEETGDQAAMPRPAPGAADPSPAAPTAKGRQPETAVKAAETLRVDIERLDQLMNLAGQLVINKARFTRIGDQLKSALAARNSSQAMRNVLGILEKIANSSAASGATEAYVELEHLRAEVRRAQNELEAVRRDVESLALARSALNDYLETVHQLELVTDSLQHTVMDTRMLPIGPLFHRFKRVVRDLSRANGKLVNLVIKGEKTELDKRMIDELNDPLIHMIRNAVDHGIEPPEVRTAAGKPPHGTVTLDAFHRGNSIVIQVSDDGKGLDADRIARKALEKGLVTETELEKMTRRQIFQLIWEPGLSTAEKVTEVSGRGMGMDIVRSKIEQLNGTVELDSQPGKGTCLTIKLPLTLAILPSLLVEIDGDVFAMPIEGVVEIVRLNNQDLHTVHGVLTARVRGRVISVVRLADVYHWANQNQRRNRQQADCTEATLVIVGEQQRELGLAVDRVIGEEDIVIKSVAENYRNVPGIAGASILGDGRVSLIIDLAALIDMASSGNIRQTTPNGGKQTIFHTSKQTVGV